MCLELEVILIAIVNADFVGVEVLRLDLHSVEFEFVLLCEFERIFWPSCKGLTRIEQVHPARRRWLC